MIEKINKANKEVFMNVLKIIGKLFLYSFIFIFSIIIFFFAYIIGMWSGVDYIYAEHNKEYIEICVKYGYPEHRCMDDIY